MTARQREGDVPAARSTGAGDTPKQRDPRWLGFVRAAVVVSGIALILFAIDAVLAYNWGLLGPALRAAGRIGAYALPFLTSALAGSLKLVIWPAIAFLLICLITEAGWWRRFLLAVVLAGSVLYFIHSLRNTGFSFGSALEFLLLMVQSYLLLLWILPRELWNLLGGIVVSVLGLLIYFLPDLPGMLDDLGLIGGVFSFVFLYLHTLASLLHRLADSSVARKIRQAVRRKMTGLKADGPNDTSRPLSNGVD